MSAPAWLTERPIAHRGLHASGRPENSLPAFAAAVEAGCPIELDVRELPDGTVVVFHDYELSRLTGRPGTVAELGLANLRATRLLGTDSWVPTLHEVLELVAGRVPLVIEAKTRRGKGRLASLLTAALTDYGGPYALQSFDPITLTRLRRLVPHVPRGLLASDFVDVELPAHEKFILRNLLLAPLCRPAYVGYDLRVLPHPAATILRRLGLPLLAWTVRTEADLARGRALADNVIFENVTP